MRTITIPAYALLSGALFGLGLAVARMTQPEKVLNFLDLFGHWDPSLALVMGAALAVTVPGFALVRRRGRALIGQPLANPAATRVDGPLVAGAMLFGIGWGLAGYCPGPAVASVGRLNPELLWFLPAMVVGMLATPALQHLIQRSR